VGGYTGFVCLPEYETETIAALARHIQQEPSWDSFQMEHVLDPRLDCFLSTFSPDKFDVRPVGRFPSSHIPLPDTWDQYLQEFLGSKTRRN
jgi:hypothetical protein